MLNESFLYTLLLLFLPTQFGKHFWPTYSHLLGFRVDYLSPTFYVTDALLLLLFFTVLFRQRLVFSRRNFQKTLPYLLFVCFLIITILPSRSHLVGFYSLIKVLELLFFGWVTVRSLSSPALYRIVPWVFGIAVICESLLGLAQVLSRGSLNGLFYFLGERSITSLTPGAATAVINGEIFLRPYGTFSHPNVLAGFLLLGLVYIFSSRMAFSFRPAPLFQIAVLLFGSVGLLLTLSRIPSILWLLFLTYQGVRKARELLGTKRLFTARTLFFTALGVTGTIASIVLLRTYFFLLLHRIAESSLLEESFVVRADLMRTALRLITEHLLIGVGLGNFLITSIQYRDPQEPLFYAVQPVHNIFLLLWAEIGTLGLILFIWFVVRSYRHAGTAGKRMLFIVLLLGLFDHYLLTLQQGQLLLAFVLGYCWVRAKALPSGDLTVSSQKISLI